MEAFVPSHHYDTLCQWWRAHQWEPVPLSALPRTGLVIPGICAGFIYSTDSDLGWIEWIVSNPESEKVERSKALDTLLEGLKEKAREMGKKVVFSSSNNAGLISRLERSGFQITDRDVTHGIWRL